MDEINIDGIVEKFKDRLLATKEAEKFRNEIVEPLIERVFAENFIKTIDNIGDQINNKVGTQVVKCYSEDKDKYVIEGLYHKVYFQKANTDIIGTSAYVNIIPIYSWKGATKHLGPISLIINTENNETKWDIPFESIENYAKKLFSGFAEDKDFTI